MPDSLFSLYLLNVADDFDPDDELEKTVMAPNPFLEPFEKTAVGPPPTDTDPGVRLEPPIALRRSRVETEALSRSAPVVPAASSAGARPNGKRLIAPIIAGGVLILGVGISAGILIARNAATAPAGLGTPLSPASASPPSNAAAPTAAIAAALNAAAPNAAAPNAAAPNAELPRGSVPAASRSTASAPKAASVVNLPPLPPPEAAPLTPPTPQATLDPPKFTARKHDVITVARREKSYLLVTSLAGVHIVVDNKALGVTPLAAPMEVGPGMHVIALAAPDGRKKVYQIDVTSGDTYKLDEKF